MSQQDEYYADYELDGRFGKFTVEHDDEPEVIKLSRERFSYLDGTHYTPVYVDRNQARELIKLLQHFVDTGELPQE